MRISDWSSDVCSSDLYATYLFAYGHYWTGMLAAFIFMVLDTVDGKLARCTITSSKWGNVADHGVDLIHPPFWWYFWGVGLGAWGLALSTQTFIWEIGRAACRERVCQYV